MDVVTPEQAKIAEEAGACAVMALERVPVDIRPAQAHTPRVLIQQEVPHEAHSPSRGDSCPRHRRWLRACRRLIRGASVSNTAMPRETQIGNPS